MVSSLKAIEASRAYYWKNRDRILAHKKTPEVRAKIRAYRKKFFSGEEGKARRRKYNQKHTYGLTPAQWEARFEQQGRTCAICRHHTPRNKKGWNTDHDHKTGEVRGILCQPCNLMLGGAKDNEETLLAAVTYLRGF